LGVIDFNNAARQGEPRPGYIDADDLKQRLNADVAGFVQWLFSGRAIIGKHEARIGDKYGEAGESLAIQLHGSDAGFWYDHATGEGGDLISLYQAYMGYDCRNFQLALKEIASEYFGDREVQISRPAWQPSAVQRIETKKAKLGDKPKAENLELGAPVENYPYHDRAGNILAVVRRYEPGGVDESGKPKKTFRASPGFPNPRPLYRVPQIIQSTHIVLCEGERKADALASLGIEATTAMGGSNTKIGDVDWQPLAGKVVTLWPDKDKAGEDYMRRVAPVLTGLGCQVAIVTPPADKPAKWDAYDCVQEGGDAAALINNARPVTTADTPQPQDYKLWTLDELEDIPPPDWLVDGLLTENGLSLFWAGSDRFKTFIAIDLAMSVATGHPWHGKPVKQGLVVYIAAEDENGVKMRMLGWRGSRGKTEHLPEPEILIFRDGISLPTPEGEKLIDAIVAQTTKKKPSLIIIDTLQRTFGTGNENQTQDMSLYTSAANAMQKRTGAAVMIIHHSGRNDDRERGNVVLRGACDQIFTVERSEDRITFINKHPKGKQKNWVPAEDMHLRMQQVSFIYKGEERTTLVPVLDDKPAQSQPKPKSKKLTPNQQLVLDTIKKAGPAGPNRLMPMTQLAKSSLYEALNKLTELGLITEPDSSGRYEISSDFSPDSSPDHDDASGPGPD
jgi:hypothetical protein